MRRSSTPEYRAWAGMLKRCKNPKDIGYKNYGGRGITVCVRWESFDNFLNDMGRKPVASYSLDRKNNDGNYEPSNCRWASRHEQAGNRRINKRGDPWRGKMSSNIPWRKRYRQIALYPEPQLLGLLKEEAEKQRRKLGPTVLQILHNYFEMQAKGGPKFADT